MGPGFGGMYEAVDALEVKYEWVCQERRMKGNTIF